MLHPPAVHLLHWAQLLQPELIQTVGEAAAADTARTALPPDSQRCNALMEQDPAAFPPGVRLSSGGLGDIGAALFETAEGDCPWTGASGRPRQCGVPLSILCLGQHQTEEAAGIVTAPLREAGAAALQQGQHTAAAVTAEAPSDAHTAAGPELQQLHVQAVQVQHQSCGGRNNIRDPGWWGLLLLRPLLRMLLLLWIPATAPLAL